LRQHHRPLYPQWDSRSYSMCIASAGFEPIKRLGYIVTETAVVPTTVPTIPCYGASPRGRLVAGGPQVNVLGFGFGSIANCLRQPIQFVPRRTMLIYCHPTPRTERMYYTNLRASLYHGYMGRKRAGLRAPEYPIAPCLVLRLSSEAGTTFFFLVIHN
jgi:hypothetical protein